MVLKMHYKFINNSTQPLQKTRTEYPYEFVVVDKWLVSKAYVHKVKFSYYEYNSDAYASGSTATVSNAF
jgi:hypothetical protein